MDMAQITKDQIISLAGLTRLKLSEDEITSLQHDISAIVDYVAMLDEVDVQDLEPTYQLNNLDNVMREDTPEDYGVDSENLLQNVDDTKDGQVVVKRMIA